MKRNQLQSSIEQFLQSNPGEFTAQEVLDSMKLPFTIPAVRYHLDSLVMKNAIKSITTSKQMPDGRNHRVVVYYK